MGKSILFVCTGNTCRSIMAEALARQWAETFAPDPGHKFISAGLAAWPDQPASAQAVETMREAGIDITGHRARQVSAELVGKADIILTMTGRHKKMLLATYPESTDKVFTLVEFAVGDDRPGKDDRPVGGHPGGAHSGGGHPVGAHPGGGHHGGSHPGNGGPGDISDPYGRPVEVYRRCAGEMRLLIEKALHKIIRQ